MSSKPDDTSYCLEQLRQFDHDRYLTVLLAPAGARDDLAALYAFNLEIAKTGEIVTEPMAGMIRLQWWREALAEAGEGAPKRHAVLTPLARPIQSGRVSVDGLTKLVNARERDLDETPPADLAELVDYAAATSGELLTAALGVLAASSPENDAAAREVGIAWALTGLARSIPFHATRGRLHLPRDIMDRHDVRERDLRDGRPSDALPGAIADIAACAREHLASARQYRGRTTRQAVPVLSLASLGESHLKRLERAAFNPYDGRVGENPPMHPWRLVRANLTGRW